MDGNKRIDALQCAHLGTVLYILIFTLIWEDMHPIWVIFGPREGARKRKNCVVRQKLCPPPTEVQ